MNNILNKGIYIMAVVITSYLIGRKAAYFAINREFQSRLDKYIQNRELQQFNNIGHVVLYGPIEDEELNPQTLRQWVIEAQSQHLTNLRLLGDTSLADYLEEKGDPTMIDSWVQWRLKQPNQ